MKSNTRKVLALILAMLMVVALFAGCGSTTTDTSNDTTGDTTTTDPNQTATTTEGGKDLHNDAIKIAYIPISTAGITNKMVDLAFKDTLADYDNITVDFFDPGYDAQTEVTMLNDCVNQGYDAIFIECADPVTLSTPVSEAEAAGIPVVTLNIGCDAVHTLHIRGVDYLSGYLAAETLANDFGADSGKKVVIVDCPAAMTATNLQSAGFEDYMNANTNWELLVLQNVDNFSQEGANTAMRDILTKYDQIDIVFCMMDDLTMGVLQAIEAAGRNDGSITVYGNMGYPSTFAALQDGSLYGLNWSDMYTEYSIAMAQVLYFIATGANASTLGLTATPQIELGVIPVTPANADMYSVLSRWPIVTAEG